MKTYVLFILIIGISMLNVYCLFDKPVINGVEPILESVLNILKTFKITNEEDFKAVTRVLTKLVESFLPFPPVPKLSEDTWWGDDSQSICNDSSIRPFAVNFSDDMINDLRPRLVRRSNVSSLRFANNTYGTNSVLLDKVINYWANGYDFKAREKHLNRHPQFVTNIQGLDIHFLHITQPSSCKKVPIILIHGSPVTAFEFTYVIDYLSSSNDENDFMFEIIAPDIPGYGYSQHTNKQGLNAYEVAVIMKNLMRRLGHEKFYVHGGDVGTFVGTALAEMYPKDVLGFHTNLPVSIMPKTLVKYAVGQLFPPAVVEFKYLDRLYPLLDYLLFLLDGSGYFHMYSTKPDMVGIGLDESPIALADWLLTFFVIGGEGGQENKYLSDGNIYKNYDVDNLLDSMTIYWTQQCLTTSARFYKEMFNFYNPINLNLLTSTVYVPYAALKFKDEIVYMPDGFLKDKFPNLVQSTTLDFGGHFAGFMDPEVLAKSIWQAVPKMKQFGKQKMLKGSLNTMF